MQSHQPMEAQPQPEQVHRVVQDDDGD